jgi:hypothetical protein
MFTFSTHRRVFTEYGGDNRFYYFLRRGPGVPAVIVFLGKPVMSIDNPSDLNFFRSRWYHVDGQSCRFSPFNRVDPAFGIEVQIRVLNHNNSHWTSILHLYHYQGVSNAFASILRKGFLGITPAQPLEFRQWKTLQGVIIVDEKDSKADAHFLPEEVLNCQVTV